MIVGALSVPGAAQAQSPKAVNGRLLPDRAIVFDLDGDGRITRTEFVAGRDARFASFDTNGDHVISAEDFTPAQRATPLASRIGRLLANADANRDGRVTRDEVGTSGTPLFDRADADGNGIVEQAEITRFRAELARLR